LYYWKTDTCVGSISNYGDLLCTLQCRFEENNFKIDKLWKFILPKDSSALRFTTVKCADSDEFHTETNGILDNNNGNNRNRLNSIFVTLHVVHHLIKN